MPPRWPRGRTSRLIARVAAVPLQHHLPDVQGKRARHVEAVGEESSIPGVGPLLGLHPADREDRLVRVAGEQVAAARTAAGQQTVARAAPPLDLGAVLGRRAGHHRRRLLLDPAEGRDVLVRAEQDPGLAGPRLGGEVRLPFGQVVVVLGDPAGHVGGAAVAHRAAQDRQPESVDLQEDDPRRVGPRHLSLAAGDPPHHTQVVLVVVVGPDQDLEHDRGRRDHQ